MEIELINVTKKYGNKVLLENFNAKFSSGLIHGIFGKSGAGKTTLLNIIGLIEEYDGKVLYDGKEIKNRRVKREMLANHIGFVFQNFGLIDELTVLDNLLLIKSINKKDLPVIQKALEKVGLPNYENRKIYELSGGEQQRIAIAKILLKNPDIILADEPTASLDDENKEIIMNYFKMLSQNGKTVIVVTHDEELLKECDDVTFINKEDKPMG